MSVIRRDNWPVDSFRMLDGSQTQEVGGRDVKQVRIEFSKAIESITGQSERYTVFRATGRAY